MIEWVTAALLVLGSFFMLLAAMGVVRLPDVWMRMHASTKSATFGIGCMQVALALSFYSDVGVLMRAIITVGFVFQTAPVAAHMIGRAAYLMGVPRWKQTMQDDLEGRYDLVTLQLASPPSASQPLAPTVEEEQT